jgi:hypothetical protein
MENTENSEHHPGGEGDQTHKRNRIERLITAISAIAEQHQRSNNQQNRERKSDRLWERAGVVALVAAALVGVAAIYIGNSDSEKSRIVTQDQLTEMKNQRLMTIAQLRANLRREQPSVTPVGEGGKLIGAGEKLLGWEINPRWTNAGSTNAEGYLGWFDILIMDRKPGQQIGNPDDCPALPKPDDLPEGAAGTVSPGHQFSQVSRRLNIDDATASLNGTKFVLIRGHIEYKDDLFPSNSLVL